MIFNLRVITSFFVILFFIAIYPSTALAAVTGVSEFGSGGSGDGQFNFNSTGIAVDSSGNVYVADGGNNRVQKFNPIGTFLTKWGNVGTGDGELTDPDDVAVDGDGNIWVLDSTRVQKFSNTGTFIASYNGTDQGGASFSGSSHLAIDSIGNVYVAKYQLVQVFDSDMNFVTSFDGDDRGGSSFNSIGGMEFDSLDNLYVNGGGNIQKFDTDYNFVTNWSGGSGGLGIDANNRIYTSQSSSTQIKIFDSSGTQTGTFSCFGSGITCVSGPSDIDFFGQTIYVAEQGSGYSSDRINIFTNDEISADPVVSVYIPEDDSVDFDVSGNLVLSFSKAVDVETGNISIYKSEDDSLFEQIDVTSDQVTGSGTTTITIDPTDSLSGSTEYYVLIDATAFDDESSNSFAGISDTTTWSFTTEATGGGSPTPTNIQTQCTVSDRTVETGEEVTATVDITVDQKPYEFEWTQILDGDGEEQTHIFEEEGEFTIRGKVYDNMGNSQLVRCPEITVTEASNSSSSNNNTDTEEEETETPQTEENEEDTTPTNTLPTFNSLDRDLEQGAQGDDVRQLQQLLNSLGFTLADEGPGSPGNETNYYGTLTQQAVAKLQTALGITPADGLLNDRTRSIANFLYMLKGLKII
jgi:hypothetical protein